MKRYPTTHQLFWGRWVLSCLFCLIALLTSTTALRAAFGGDQDRPKPEFSRQGETITAKLIPHGRTTSIQIDFAASGGELRSVEAMDFAKAKRSGVDEKDFRSGLFIVKVGGIPPGRDIRVSMASNFFTKSTQFWVFNPNALKPWIMAKAEHAQAPDRVEALRIKVKDGGPLDRDGQANGKVVLIFGPRDSFWGYAIGTLFIRFFGVIMVLTVLLIGMKLASKVFRFIENRVAQGKAEAEMTLIEPVAVPEIEPPAMDESKAAAIAVALHLHLAPAPLWQFLPPGTPAWSHEGRARIMSGRLLVFNRGDHGESTRLS
jgi:hypothetical protein